MAFSVENPWIKKRETILCTWKVDYNRGFVNNMNASLAVDFMSFPNRKIADYVKMIKACGYTGIQATDMCSAWRASGGWEIVHDRYKILAEECHKNGMEFTLWVWAAEFSGHGWHDDDATYRNADPEKPAWEDPKVYAFFNKYYDIYADMAPWCDRMIAHFFDPGNLVDMPSILTFTKLLADKFKAKKPDIEIGIDTWGSPAEYPDELVKAGMNDIMLMELPFLPTWKDRRAEFRQGVKDLGCSLGVWSWYTSEYEIDQLPMMIVNSRVAADVLNQTRQQGDHVKVPDYWSEMDSYHIINFFSMYVTGHLLIDPEADPDALLADAALAVAGKENAAKLLEIVEVVRDARSGDTWNTYWWREPGHVHLHGDYAPILPKAEKAVALLEELIEAAEPEDGIVFPMKRRDFYRLMLPHLHQIRQYADFKVQLAAAKELAAKGADKAELQALADAMPYEIPEYNCVVGPWGQVEGNFAYNQLVDFCKENGLTAPRRDAVRFMTKRKMIDYITVHQRGLKEPKFLSRNYFEGRLSFGNQYIDELLEELINEGTLLTREDGKVALAHWKNLIFDFNI